MRLSHYGVADLRRNTVRPQSRALAQGLLDHLRHMRSLKDTKWIRLEEWVIPYRELCERAGVPELTRCVGNFLVEIADWCTENSWPPLNSLAVNDESRMPGHGYDGAPGCSLLHWPDEAEACIRFENYPESVV